MEKFDEKVYPRKVLQSTYKSHIQDDLDCLSLSEAVKYFQDLQTRVYRDHPNASKIFLDHEYDYDSSSLNLLVETLESDEVYETRVGILKGQESVKLEKRRAQFLKLKEEFGDE